MCQSSHSLFQVNSSDNLIMYIPFLQCLGLFLHILIRCCTGTDSEFQQDVLRFLKEFNFGKGKFWEAGDVTSVVWEYSQRSLNSGVTG